MKYQTSKIIHKDFHATLNQVGKNA